MDTLQDLEIAYQVVVTIYQQAKENSPIEAAAFTMVTFLLQTIEERKRQLKRLN